MRAAVIALLFLVPLPVAGNPARRVERTVVINGSVAEVWDEWTTEQGIRSFFAPAAKIDLRPGGAYEMYFVPSLAPGLQGGEGNQIISIDPQRTLMFTWNAPPKFGALRDVRTYVVMRFEPVSAAKTRIRFTHFGFGEGAEWNAVYAYFDEAWDTVFADLARVDFH